jgi:hypothetical protein
VAYHKLEAFVADNPEFQAELPRKQSCPDDGTYGASTALGTFLQDHYSRSRRDDTPTCCVS